MTFSKIKILNLHKQYINTKYYSLAKFCKENFLNYQTIYSRFKRMGLEIRPQYITQRKTEINYNYFNKVDSEEKSYFLGLLFADGCIDLKRNKLCLSQAQQDEYLVRKLSYILHKKDVTKKYNYGINTQPTIILTVINYKIVQSLLNHGLTPRKTFTAKFPNLDKKFISSFIRGYFDGDGSITLCKRRKRGKFYIEAQFSIVGTIEMIGQIQSIFKNLKINSTITKRFPERKNNNFTLRVHGNRQIQKCLDYLYKESSIHSPRKYQTYIKLIKQNNKYKKSTR